MDRSMDKIVVRGLMCEMRIGVEAAERRYPQFCLVDMELCLDLEAAGRSDRAEDTIDYARLCAAVRELAASREYRLLESFAEAVAQAALRQGAAREVRVYVEKVPLPLQGILKSVGVEVVRRKGAPASG